MSFCWFDQSRVAHHFEAVFFLVLLIEEEVLGGLSININLISVDVFIEVFYVERWLSLLAQTFPLPVIKLQLLHPAPRGRLYFLEEVRAEPALVG